MYWAYPGHHSFADLRVHLAEDSYSQLAQAVKTIVIALQSGGYRRHSHLHHQPVDPDDADLRDEIGEHLAAERPYFEVLLVDILTAQQERYTTPGPQAYAQGGG